MQCYFLKEDKQCLKRLKMEYFQRSKQSEQSKNDDIWNNVSNTSFSSDSEISLFTPLKGTRLKILTLKEMLQRLAIALAQVKTVSNLENLLNEIRQIVYSLYQSKEITKKVYSSIIKSIQI